MSRDPLTEGQQDGDMKAVGLSNLEQTLADLRTRLERAFSPETAAPGFAGQAQSTGHCAAVSVIVSRLLGAAMVSAKIHGQSHWFNRISVGAEQYDLDLTGDQYGFPPVQCTQAEKLYPATRVRSQEEINAETLRRARLLATRAGFPAVASSL